MRAALTLLALAASASVSSAQPAGNPAFGSGGTVEDATTAFQAICMAHPGDAATQRTTALALKPKPFHPAEGSPPGIESFTLYFTQLSLLATPQGQVCAVLSPMFDPPAPPVALAAVRRRLHLGKPAVAGEQWIWHRNVGMQAQIVAFSYHTQADAMGRPRQTVQLTLSVPQAN